MGKPKVRSLANREQQKQIMVERVNRLREIRASITELNNQKTMLNEEIKEIFISMGLGPNSKVEDENGFSASWIAPTHEVIDEAGLRKEIGEERWEEITVRVLDPDLLIAAQIRGTIPPEIVNKYTQRITKEKGQYIK